VPDTMRRNKPLVSTDRGLRRLTVRAIYLAHTQPAVAITAYKLIMHTRSAWR